VKPTQTIVISGVNFFEGGPLSLIKDCLRFLEASPISSKFRVVALISEKKFYADLSLKNIELLEFPAVRRSYLRRLYHEYFYFRKVAKDLNAAFWLSLHDISPLLDDVPQAVYCHNPSPFYKSSSKDLRIDFSFVLFTWFYRHLYRINIHSNTWVIVQQDWLRKEFASMFRLPRESIIVAPPQINVPYRIESTQSPGNIKRFFYPTLSRVFKNVEVVCEAIKIIVAENPVANVEFIVTLDGTENKYSKWLLEQYKAIPQIKFIGRQTREKVFEYYSISDYLIFPSKLETWGLPISEFKASGKPMIVADLPYAHETVGHYHAVSFFDPDSPVKLADLIRSYVDQTITFGRVSIDTPQEPYAKDWENLFEYLIPTALAGNEILS
jgi:glycosyltransferase involved in cell wall biosynthesis